MEIHQKRDSMHITLFLSGDVMTGRGIDQILTYPGNPVLHEPYMTSARGYVEIAEAANGPIQKPVNWNYIWGSALNELNQEKPDIRLINLETSITTSEEYSPMKGIHYRMNPKNINCLTAAKIDCCSLANNHVLDWGAKGLQETLETLRTANITFAGAGETLNEAKKPAILEIKDKGRVVVFSYGAESSGIPADWSALDHRPGINLLTSLCREEIRNLQEQVRAVKQQGDIVVLSIHWGGNWGYYISDQQIEFAHQLIDEAGVDMIHGHSSHHPKGIEVYQGKLILYGCGDFLNDYEGIKGYEEYRDDLALLYFANIDSLSGNLSQLKMIPIQLKNFRANSASTSDTLWLQKLLSREGKQLGTHIEITEDNHLLLSWD